MKTSRQQLACLAMLACASFFWLVSPASGESAGAVAGALQLNPSALPAGQATIPTKNLLEVVRDGGPLMIVLGVCSFILFVFVFERAISLRRGRIIPRPFVKRFLEQLQEGDIDRAKAIELCQQNRTPTAQVFEAAVQKWGRPAVEVEQAIIDSGERVTYGLRRNLRLINGVATVAPLLGLLGTVVGMIQAFNVLAIADAMGRPELLATGISQALLTTAAGMSIAIPALIAYMFFISRVDRLIIEIDALGQKVVSLISADTWQNETPPGKSKSNRREKAA